MAYQTWYWNHGRALEAVVSLPPTHLQVRKPLLEKSDLWLD